jgi:flagellar motor protein MotB
VADQLAAPCDLGQGETQLIETNATEDSCQANRGVEIYVAPVTQG